MFSCEYCAIFKNTFLEEHVSTVAFNYANMGTLFEKICYTDWKKSTILVKVSLLFGVKEGTIQFIIFKLLSYCFKETIGFEINASFASRSLSHLIR